MRLGAAWRSEAREQPAAADCPRRRPPSAGCSGVRGCAGGQRHPAQRSLGAVGLAGALAADTAPPSRRAPAARLGSAWAGVHQVRPIALHAAGHAAAWTMRRNWRSCRTMCRPFPASRRGRWSRRPWARTSRRGSAALTSSLWPRPPSPQVHGAVLADGAEVVAKVVRPDIEGTMRADLEVLARLAGWIDRHIAASRRLRLPEVAADYAGTVLKELDHASGGGQHATAAGELCRFEPALCALGASRADKAESPSAGARPRACRSARWRPSKRREPTWRSWPGGGGDLLHPGFRT